MCTKDKNSCCPEVGVSILNCDFLNIKAEVAELVRSGVDYVHLDVMDGCFVDDITFGPSFIKSLIQQFPDQKFEVHMMVQHPMKFIEPMARAGIMQYIFHYEVTKDCDDPQYASSAAEHSCTELITAIRQHKMQASVAINPGTPVERIYFCVDHLAVDSVLIMTVQPGLGGQRFRESMLDKVRALREKYPVLDIELDGGVGPANIRECGMSGANRVVCGTALIRSEDKPGDIVMMRNLLYSKSNN